MLRSLSDDALLEVMRPRPWERRFQHAAFSRWGIATVLLLTAALVLGVCALAYDPRGVPVVVIIGCVVLAIFAWLVLALFSYVGIWCVLNFRCRAERRELERRYGGGTQAGYLEELQKEIRQPDGPEQIIHFAGSALPHGGDTLIRLRLYSDGRDGRDGRGELEYRSLCRRYLHGEDNELPELCRKTCELTKADLGEAVGLLASQTQGSSRIPTTVRDGFPCGLIAVSRHRATPIMLTCNLAGLSAAQSAQPAVKLARWMLEIANRHGRAPAVVGSCNSSSGSVEIAGM